MKHLSTFITYVYGAILIIGMIGTLIYTGEPAYAIGWPIYWGFIGIVELGNWAGGY